ncbi:MAG: hypothetical protein RLZZ450_1742 [Pseudomonadota bacterium]|jgi:ribosomal protein S27AE
MSLYLTTLSLIPLFVSRAVLPLLATAILARLGLAMSQPGVAEGLAWLNVVPASTIPSWATSDAGLLALGTLAALEFASQHVAELRNLGSRTHTFVRAVAAAFLTAVLLGDPAYATAGGVAGVPLVTSAAVGSLAMLWAAGVGCTVWFFAGMRRTIFEFLEDSDPDDDLRLQRLLAWAEDGIGLVGVFLVLLVPFLTALLALVAMLMLYLGQRYLDRRVASDVVPCPACAVSLQRAALACPSCRATQQAPRQVGLLGVATHAAVVDRRAHRQSLLKKRRCPSCASRFAEHRADQHCTQCGTPAFVSTVERDAYLSELDRALPTTLLISAAFSAIPVVGLIPGIIYYRVTLVSAVRGYIPRGQGFVLRIALRIFKFVLLCVQWIPLLGSLAMPLMCLVDYRVYRAALKNQSITPREPSPFPSRAPNSAFPREPYGPRS